LSGRNSAHHFPLTPASADSEIRVTGGAVPSFSALYYKYFDFVWSSTKYLGVGPDAIDDVVQEVFMVIHSRLHTQQHPEAMRSWIYGIVRRTVSTHRRSNRARAGLEMRWEQARVVPPATPLQLAELTARVELLSSLLAELDEAKREVFVAAELEEMSVPEIAAALEIPLNTAYSRLRAARQLFEDRLARRTALEKGRQGT
jgi:RNA polymerase sigma-70 factor (ECF subfamily)